MKRSGPITRTTPVKARNPKRRAENFARAYGSPERVAFVKSLPCSVLGCMEHPCENAHVGERAGMGLKGNADTIIPLCSKHHRLYHSMGRSSFSSSLNVDYHYHAHLTELAWSMVNPEEK